MQKHYWLMIAGFAAVSLLSSCGPEKKETTHHEMHDHDDEDNDRVAQATNQEHDAEVVAFAQEGVEHDNSMHVAQIGDVDTLGSIEADDQKA